MTHIILMSLIIISVLLILVTDDPTLSGSHSKFIPFGTNLTKKFEYSNLKIQIYNNYVINIKLVNYIYIYIIFLLYI